MKQLIYDPKKFGKRMTIVCFVSGSGTNYREIVKRDSNHNYVVFTNRPGCGGEILARENKHPIIELSHIPYLEDARKQYGAGNVPRNCQARIGYEQEICRLIESQIDGEPDLICLAGYDQWLTDWIVDKYYPRILNVHPGDTVKGYDGLHWVPTAKAILAGDEAIKSTLFLVDNSKALQTSRVNVRNSFPAKLSTSSDVFTVGRELTVVEPSRTSLTSHLGMYTFLSLLGGSCPNNSNCLRIIPPAELSAK